MHITQQKRSALAKKHREQGRKAGLCALASRKAGE